MLSQYQSRIIHIARANFDAVYAFAACFVRGLNYLSLYPLTRKKTLYLGCLRYASQNNGYILQGILTSFFTYGFKTKDYFVLLILLCIFKKKCSIAQKMLDFYIYLCYNLINDLLGVKYGRDHR